MLRCVYLGNVYYGAKIRKDYHIRTMNGELFSFLPCFCLLWLESWSSGRASEVQVLAAMSEAWICRGNSLFLASENGAFAARLRRGCKYAIFERKNYTSDCQHLTTKRAGKMPGIYICKALFGAKKHTSNREKARVLPPEEPNAFWRNGTARRQKVRFPSAREAQRETIYAISFRNAHQVL